MSRSRSADRGVAAGVLAMFLAVGVCALPRGAFALGGSESAPEQSVDSATIVPMADRGSPVSPGTMVRVNADILAMNDGPGTVAAVRARTAAGALWLLYLEGPTTEQMLAEAQGQHARIEGTLMRVPEGPRPGLLSVARWDTHTAD